MSASRTVLRLEDVVKVYDSTPPVRAVDGISFTVEEGELLGVVGPSGSGKSTLLHVMGTLDRASSGLVEVVGYDVSKLSDRKLSSLRSRHIGFVFQQFHLLSGYTALDNVADGLLYTGLPLDERRFHAAVALDRVGMGHRLDHLATKLSGGERQRVAVARAIIGSPEIVLADEPTGNLDTATGDSVMALLRELVDMGTTVIVITHDREIADGLPRTIAIRDGKIERETVAAGAAI